MKVLVQTIYPAPYRVGVFNKMNECDDVELTVVFEGDSGDDRNSQWFEKNFKFDTIILKDKLEIKRYKEEIKNIKKYDIVIAYEYSTVSAMKLMLRCKALKIPYIINCDGAIISEHKNIKDIVKRFFVKNATACFANGKSAERYFLMHGAQKEDIYYHNFSSLYEKDILKEPVSIKKKQELKEKNGIDKNKKVFLSIGSYIYRKGFDLILEVDKKLKNENVEFISIGGGEKYTEYNDIVKKYNLDNIVFKKFMKKQELLEFYDMADIFLFPTREDIWGLVVNEAMGRGLPVITTDNCNAGLELIENNKNGEIIKTNSAEELENVIRKYMNMTNEKLYTYGQKSIEKIKDYTIENISESHIKVLKKIFKGK